VSACYAVQKAFRPLNGVAMKNRSRSDSPTVMRSIIKKIPEKFFGYGFFAFLALSFGLMRSYPLTALLVIVASALCFFQARDPEGRAKISTQDWLLLAVIYLPTLFTFSYIYMDEANHRRFTSYLAAHNCVHIREDLARMSIESCDSRTGMCDEGGDTYESVYHCVNGNEITLRDFANGGFGALPE
jgi:hypothetical protein